MLLRNITEDDYESILSVLNEWWNGRSMTHLLPRLFFSHFQNTSWVIEENRRIIGFLIGFLSQSKIGEAYIHFVGVDPTYRYQGIAKRLYLHFFETVQNQGCHTVRCITSPVNKDSIAYHTKMGFQMEKSTIIENGIPIFPNYDGKGDPRVCFVKKLSE
ncbi:GNAT family N-acetyltransferase [Hazenella coriacea]|uniref:N-acetyltransferase domain-containing protein n=1 Tax=Hazenella coriacea TaxID=1179467 RepID=A0A4R3L4U1_9BACL|nr:GNAT family N-acetyltransferase [Hazenella coriacea]TCS93154.1 hypothetical protein EDD58_10996 [Hazenella coriacea]